MESRLLLRLLAIKLHSVQEVDALLCSQKILVDKRVLVLQVAGKFGVYGFIGEHLVHDIEQTGSDAIFKRAVGALVEGILVERATVPLDQFLCHTLAQLGFAFQLLFRDSVNLGKRLWAFQLFQVSYTRIRREGMRDSGWQGKPWILDLA